MFKRLLVFPQGEQSFFLFGPRGTGKTFLVRQQFPDALYLDLLDFSLYSQLQARPDRLDTFIPLDYTGLVIIDEVQRIPELLQQVHRLIEQRKIRFLLTGSSARSLKRNGANLLAGRAHVYHLHPLIIQEIGAGFDLQHAVRYGLLPLSVTQSDPETYMRSYVQTYVKEEVLQEGLTRNIGAFSRFLEVASFSQGNVLNMSEIARELAVNRQVVANYFSILEDLLLAVMVPPFTLRAKRRMIAHNKFYFFDSGVYWSIRPSGLLDTQEEAEGVALETVLFQSIRALIDYSFKNQKIYFWRTATGLEVDFVVHGPNGLYAFEVKRSSVVTSKQLRALNAFGEEYTEAKLYMFYLGNHAEYHGRITVLPFTQGLHQLPQLLSGVQAK